MKPFARLLIATVLTGPGCVTLDKNFFVPKPPPPVVKEPEAPPPPPPSVTAAQITEKNAAVMLDALRDELDYAAEQYQPPHGRPAGKKP